MTLQELLDRTRDYVSGRSYRGQVLSDAEVTVELNHGLRTLGPKLKMFDPRITLSLTEGQDVYDVQNPSVVSKLVIEPYSVTINGSLLWDSQGVTGSVQSLQELEACRPGWRTMTSGTPDVAVWYGSHRLLLNPSPTSTVAVSGNNFIAGFVYPGASPASGGYYSTGLVSTDLTSSPDLDLGLQDCLCYMAAQYLLMPISDSQNWAKVGAYNSEWVSMADTISRMNARAVSPYGQGSYYRRTTYYGR